MNPLNYNGSNRVIWTVGLKANCVEDLSKSINEYISDLESNSIGYEFTIVDIQYRPGLIRRPSALITIQGNNMLKARMEGKMR